MISRSARRLTFRRRGGLIKVTREENIRWHRQPTSMPRSPVMSGARTRPAGPACSVATPSAASGSTCCPISRPSPSSCTRVNPRVLAGTADGVWRSEDRGATFARADFPDNGKQIWSFLVDASNPDRVYAGGSPVDVYRSENRGKSWLRLPRPGIAERRPARGKPGGFGNRNSP